MSTPIRRLGLAVAALVIAAGCGSGSAPHHHRANYKRMAENVIASAGYTHVACTDELNLLGQRVESCSGYCDQFWSTPNRSFTFTDKDGRVWSASIDQSGQLSAQCGP